MSYSKLKGRIVEKFGSQDSFAVAVGINRSTLNLKLNGKSEWSRGEIEKVASFLDISIEEIHTYFFTKKVG